MRLYIELIKNQFKSGLTYRFNYFTGLIGRILTIFAQFYIWRALLLNNSVETSFGVIGFSEMVTYIIVSSIIDSITSNNVIGEINQKIYRGQIAMDFIKPMNYKFYLFCESLGGNLYQFFFYLIPVSIVSISIFGIQLPTILNFLFLIISIIGGLFVNYFLCFCLGLLGFWFSQVWILNRLLNDFIKLFSGYIIPLWFFPSILLNISNYLPFRLIYFVPISIYLGKYDNYEIMELLLYQLIWIIVLFFMGQFIWQKAIKKLVVQGG